MTKSGKPVRLPTEFKKKVWGGEVWFQADLPLLVKFVIASEKLSVQVHPDDQFAAIHENSRGKTEMWHIVEAKPGARIALGFRESISRERMHETALSGEIENLLQWLEVKTGDTFYIPAHTVHALGEGLTVCEIQQHSDITYRLYDYGRGRPLHLVKGLEVADGCPANTTSQSFPVHCKYFHTERFQVESSFTYPETDRFHMLVCLSGTGTIAGEPFGPRDGWLIPGGCSAFAIEAADPATLLCTWVP